MYLIAGDDDDYRELVKTLINKRKLKVKKKLLKEFSSEMDPDDVKDIGNDIDKDMTSANKNYDSVINRLSEDKQKTFKEATNKLNSKISSEKSKYQRLGFTSRESVENLVKTVIYYQNALSEAGKAEFTTKEIEKTLNNFYNFVLEGSKKLESSKIKIDEAIKAVVKATLNFMNQDKPQPFEKMGSQVFKSAKDDLEEKTAGSSEVEKEVTGPLTPEILDPEDVEKAIKKASEETGEKNPTTKEIIAEIESETKAYYESNKEILLNKIKAKVEEFNKMSDDKRKEDKLHHKYALNSKNKLDIPTADILPVLYKNLLQLAGKIVPVFNIIEGRKSEAFHITLNFLFEIYAIKKNESGELSEDETDAIIENIKEKYS